MFARVCIAVLALFCLALSQNTTGTVSGLITDPSSVGVPKAEIIFVNENTGLRRTVESNEDGSYRIPFLPIGMYSVTVKMEGFRSETQKGVQLEILQVRTVDFALQVGAVTRSGNSQAGEVIKTEQVTNLPLGRRNFMQLTFLTPMSTPATRDFRSTEIGRGTAIPTVSETAIYPKASALWTASSTTLPSSCYQTAESRAGWEIPDATTYANPVSRILTYRSSRTRAYSRLINPGSVGRCTTLGITQTGVRQR